MSHISQQETLERFFKSYEEGFNRALTDNAPDIMASAAAFADCFVAASPAGVQCGKNDAQFLAAIPQGYEFYRSIGITSMSIVSLKTTFIDSLHAMVTVTWRSDYINRSGVEGSIIFDVTYILQMIGGSFRIFAWITGDEQAELKAHGLV